VPLCWRDANARGRGGIDQGSRPVKLYDCKTAPNPRRVRIFLAEKGLEIPIVQVNLGAGEQFSPAYRAINSRCTVPCLLLDDGTAIGEVDAICRYIEDIHPEPPLYGSTAKESALVSMWERRMELDGLLAAGEAFRNMVPGLKGRALVGPHGYEQIPALAERGAARVRHFHQDLDAHLSESAFIAGPAFSVADITAIVAIDFAASRIKLAIPDGASALRRWHNAVSARPSMAA
jgi:glutathione S-transferase